MSDASPASPFVAPVDSSSAQARADHDDPTRLDTLLAAACAEDQPVALRKDRLLQAADLCESELNDLAGAIRALRRIVALDPADRATRRSLADLLEANERWEELAILLEREANIEVEVDKKIAMLRHLASIHERKRGDPLGAAEALASVANLVPAADGAIAAAATAFERADADEQAARIIEGNVEWVEDATLRTGLLERLGGLRERLSDFAGAAEAYAQAGEATDSARLWEMAERCFTAAQIWERAARSAVQCAYDSAEPRTRGRLLARAADHFGRAGDVSSSLFNLELAVDIDPSSSELAIRLADRYASAGQWAELVVHAVRVAGELADREARISLRRTAANVSATHLSDRARARQLWERLLEDGDDREALERLIDDAVRAGDEAEAGKWIDRLDAAALQGAGEAAEAWRNVLRAKHPQEEAAKEADDTQVADAVVVQPEEAPEEALEEALEALEEAPEEAPNDAPREASPPEKPEEQRAAPPTDDVTDDVIIADDLAELFQEASQPDIPIEVGLEGAAPPPPELTAPERDRKGKKKRKRSLPPPLPL